MEEGKIHFENTEPFTALVITPNKMEDKNWASDTYLQDLSNDSFCKYIKVNPNTQDYLNFLEEHLDVKGFREYNTEEPYIKMQVIHEARDYVYEIMYFDIPQGPARLINEFGTLLNINNDKIIGNAIVTRSYVSSTDDKMYLDNITPEIIQQMLFKRANTTVVLFDSDDEIYKETLVMGSIDDYAELFFDEKKFQIKKLELPFLKHNINIWYTEDKYGNLDVCGNLLPDTCRVDKMLVFSYWTDDIRDSFSLDEFMKIINLSKKLTDYITPYEYTTEEKDELGRNIIKNKYRVLNKIYHSYNQK
jgi:hypothetical protein